MSDAGTSANPRLNTGATAQAAAPAAPVAKAAVYQEGDFGGETRALVDVLPGDRQLPIKRLIDQISTDGVVVTNPESSVEDLNEQLYALFLDTEFKDVGETFEFQGFDPKYMFRRLLHLSGNNLDVLNKDMYNLINFYVYRGTKIQKATKKMSKMGIAKIKKIASDYDIKDITPKDKNDITVPRVMAVFPALVAMVLKTTKREPVIVVPCLPAALAFPAAPSIIPRGIAWAPYRFLHYIYTYLFNQLINPKKKIVVDYDAISFASTYISQAKRLEIMQDLDNKFTGVQNSIMGTEQVIESMNIEETVLYTRIDGKRAAIRSARQDEEQEEDEDKESPIPRSRASRKRPAKAAKKPAKRARTSTPKDSSEGQEPRFSKPAPEKATTSAPMEEEESEEEDEEQEKAPETFPERDPLPTDIQSMTEVDKLLYGTSGEMSMFAIHRSTLISTPLCSWQQVAG